MDKNFEEGDLWLTRGGKYAEILLVNKDGSLLVLVYGGCGMWLMAHSYFPSGRMATDGGIDSVWDLVNRLEITINEIISVIKDSDDFDKHRDVFMTASINLLDKKQITLEDFEILWGWVKSGKANPEGKECLYFTYSGGLVLKNKIYLDTENLILSGPFGEYKI